MKLPKIILVIVFLYFSNIELWAQSPPPPPGSANPAPLGGVALLVAAGAALGVKAQQNLRNRE